MEAFIEQLKAIASSGDRSQLQALLQQADVGKVERESENNRGKEDREGSDKRKASSLLRAPITEQGSTVLMVLAAMGRADLVEELFESDSGLEVDQVNNNGTTALVFACSTGQLQAVKILCTKGADVDWAIHSGDTPLTVSAEDGFDDIVDYLCVVRKADIEKKNENGQTALHCACSGCHASTAALLLSYGANIEATDNFRATPLVVACMYGFVDVARLLLEKGADTGCISEAILTTKCQGDENSECNLNSLKNALIELLVSYNWLPSLDFQRSCQKDDICTAKRLITSYPSFREAVYANRPIGGGGSTALMIACLHKSLSIVKYIVTDHPNDDSAACDYQDKKVDGLELIEGRSDDQRTCIFYAAWSGALQVLRYLVLDCNADVKAVNMQGRSAIYYACHNGHADCVEFLLANGAEKNGIDRSVLDSMPMAASTLSADETALSDKKDQRTKIEKLMLDE